MTEHDLQNTIRLTLTLMGYRVFRVNVVGAYTRDGRYIPPSVPKGFSDLFVIKNGAASFVEVKVKPNKPTPDQMHFIEQMKNLGCRAGVAYTIEDAINIVEGRHG